MKGHRVRVIYAVIISLTVLLFIGCYITAANSAEKYYDVAMRAPSGETVIMKCQLAEPAPQPQAR